MKRKNRKWLQLNILVIITLCILGSVLFLANRREEKTLEGYTEQIYCSIDYLKDVSEKNKKGVVNMLYNLYITPEVNEIISEADEDKGVARDKLYELLEPVYGEMVDFGIMDFQFFLDDGQALMDFSNPEKYEAFEITESSIINQVIKSESFAMGFETNNGINAYRYVYPIYYEEAFVGLVEFGFHSADIFKPVNLTYEVDSLLLVDKAVIEANTEVSEDLMSNRYYEDVVLDSYYIETDSDVEFLWEKLKISRNSYTKLISSVNEKIEQENFEELHYQILDNKLVWHMSIPITNIEGQVEGYAVFLKNDETLCGNYNDYKSNKLVNVLVIAMLTALFFIFMYLFRVIQRQRNYDNLTSLYDRHSIRGYLKKLSGNHIFLMIDIDNLRRVNETYGSSDGDRILEKLGELVIRKIRRDDTAIRWCGEEILLILKNVEIKDAVERAENIRETVMNMYLGEHKITLSIGVATFNGDYSESIKKAEKALKIAKEKGKNRVEVFEEVEGRI